MRTGSIAPAQRGDRRKEVLQWVADYDKDVNWRLEEDDLMDNLLDEGTIWISSGSEYDPSVQCASLLPSDPIGSLVPRTFRDALLKLLTF
jgi:hypothetical protein